MNCIHQLRNLEFSKEIFLVILLLSAFFFSQTLSAEEDATSKILYDSTGEAVAYVNQDRGTTILFRASGEPFAYVSDEAIYRFDGKHLGWYENGIFYDGRGYMVAFPESHAPNTVVIRTNRIEIVTKPIPPRVTAIETVTSKPIFLPEISSKPFKAYITVEPAL
jgi:hypothetical protein